MFDTHFVFPLFLHWSFATKADFCGTASLTPKKPREEGKSEEPLQLHYYTEQLHCLTNVFQLLVFIGVIMISEHHPMHLILGPALF